MPIEYTKENDYVIVEYNRILGSDTRGPATVHKMYSITRTFNFMSAQLTTQTCDQVYQSRYGDSGAAVSVTSQLHIQNFSDLPSLREVEFMHKKLIEMEGNPPPLEEILSDNMGKPKYASLERKP